MDTAVRHDARNEPPVIRALRAFQSASNPLTRKASAVVFHALKTLNACDLSPTTQIGTGLMLPHPLCVVIHPASVIGRNACIMQGVTLGVGSLPGAPILGDFVDCGAGAKILGGVKIGDGAIIGANAVVTQDVPAWHVARGIPARCYPMTESQIAVRKAHHGIN